MATQQLDRVQQACREFRAAGMHPTEVVEASFTAICPACRNREVTVTAADGIGVDITCPDGCDRMQIAQALYALRPPAVDMFQPLSALDLLTLPDPEWLVEGMVPEGTSVLFGQPGTFKSFVALDLALSVASGRDWLGRPVKAGNVVYVVAEGIRGMRQRVDAWLTANEGANIERIFFVGEAVNLLDPDLVERIWRTLDYVGDVRLLVIDTMARSMIGGDENSARDVGRFIHELDGLPAATRLVVHHTGKNGEHERGSGALRGAADMMARIEREGLSPRIDLICDKPPKDGEAWPTVTLQREEIADSMVTAMVPVFETVGVALQERRQRILDFLKQNGPSSRNAIEKGVTGNNDQIRAALDQLVMDGEVIETKQGRTRRFEIPRPCL